MPGIDETENEWRYRVKDPDLFIKSDDAWSQKEIADGISIVLGKLKSKGKDSSTVTQAYRFSKDNFKTRKSVEKWLKEHEVD